LIDMMKEEVRRLREAREWFPRRRNGKLPAVATMYRFCNEGYHGIRLEYVQVAGTRCTSRDAVVRFIERCSNLTNPEAASLAPPPLTARQVDDGLVKSGFERRRAAADRSTNRETNGGGPNVVSTSPPAFSDEVQP
jgi:hypothetical protein